MTFRIIILLLLFIFASIFSSASAAEIDMLAKALQNDSAQVQVLEEKKYYICNTCPQITSLNRIVEVKHTPVVIRLAQVAPPVAPPQKIEKKQEQESVEITLYFALNKSNLKGGEARKLASAIPSLKMAEKIAITGYTCNIGSKPYNDKLALKRANTIARYIETKGISREKMDVSGTGKCCYKDTANSGSNRRVEIKTFNQ